MFWNKKDNENGLPDLPPSTPVPIPSTITLSSIENDSDDEEENSDRHGLPSFPDSPMQKGFSQSAIKDAVSNETIEENEEPETITTPHDESAFKAVEMDDWSPNQKLAPPPEIPSIPTKTEFTKISIAPPPRPISFTPLPVPAPREKSNEIFIKIDKFYSAKKALNQTKSKIEEIDKLLNKIRETKMREEQELSAWEKDLSAVKARIKEVTESIFEKIE
ncbi:hypothetical protein COU54_03435 [Candidatus Pacearchaeota archaeon CG10_big_fil_rev_8_21_14_0_10_31_24]|nr:MAG: hypothetical protein COU54_03435 [Candidatus Pacearchaeota archaeon CG10_big_fil_rev_8_21_14_0_10_31_24]